MESKSQCPKASSFDSVVVDGIAKTFANGVEALRSVSFTVAPGAVVSLLGPSGCGKSTLLRVMAGLERESAGSILVGTSRPSDLRKRGRIGMAFQDPALLPWRTVRDNVAFPLDVFNQPNPDSPDALLTLVRLSNASHLLPHQLSGGMAQRVSVARALVARPDLLLLDEPFGALDWFLRKRIIADFEETLFERRPTTVLVTHELREAVFLGDRVLVMSPQPGTIVGEVPIDLPRPRPAGVMASDQFRRVCDAVEAMCESNYD